MFGSKMAEDLKSRIELDKYYVINQEETRSLV